MVNAPLLRKELEHVTAHRDEWRQNSWLMLSTATACGTTGCLAGNTVLHAGWRPMFNGLPIDDVPELARQSFGAVKLVEVVQDKVVLTISDAATRELELTGYQAAALFNARNTLLELWLYAELFTDGEVEVPLAVYEEHARKTITTYALDRWREVVRLNYEVVRLNYRAVL